jgi:hypothetical protein
MVIDIELTLNRFGFGRIAENKFMEEKTTLLMSGFSIPARVFEGFQILLLYF